MPSLSTPSSALQWFYLPAALALLGALGCVDEDAGGGIYVFDNSTRTVLVWKGVEELYAAARDGKEVPKVDRTISGSLLNDINLAWGGMALDTINNRLYLVSENGKVCVVSNPRTQQGALSASADIITFNLGKADSDKFNSGSVFGQVSVDPNKNILYVMENAKNGEAARIWHVGNASRVQKGETLGKDGHTFVAEGDEWGAGVAAGTGHKVYGLFGGGKEFRDIYDKAITGPRLREGTAGAFPVNPLHQHPINTLAGEKPQFPKPLRFGSLAYDGQHHALYVFVPPAAPADPPQSLHGPGSADETMTADTPEKPKASILVFGAGQFHGNHDQAPNRTMPDVPQDLRIIVHPLHSDWMLGAAFTPAAGKTDQGRGRGTGQKTLYIWKSPSEGGAPVKLPNLPGTTEIRGMAIGTTEQNACIRERLRVPLSGCNGLTQNSSWLPWGPGLNR